MKYYINVSDFENNRLYLSPNGVTSDALKDGLEWDYIPTIEEVKKIYGQGWDYVRVVDILDEDCNLIKMEPNYLKDNKDEEDYKVYTPEEMDARVNYYIRQGIGYDCSTSELNILKYFMCHDDEKLRDDLSYLENYKLKKIYLRDNTIDAYKINKEINLVVIAYRHKSLDRFLRDRIERW